jgi:hypothetical protein
MDQRVFPIGAVADDPRRLTQAVLQVTALLGFYQAELARILKVTCADIGQLAAGRRCLEPDTMAWRQALLFVRLYRILYARHDGDGAAMCHWLRIPQASCGGVPHLLLVDEGRLPDVLRRLERSAGA